MLLLQTSLLLSISGVYGQNSQLVLIYKNLTNINELSKHNGKSLQTNIQKLMNETSQKKSLLNLSTIDKNTRYLETSFPSSEFHEISEHDKSIEQPMSVSNIVQSLVDKELGKNKVDSEFVQNLLKFNTNRNNSEINFYSSLNKYATKIASADSIETSTNSVLKNVLPVDDRSNIPYFQEEENLTNTAPRSRSGYIEFESLDREDQYNTKFENSFTNSDGYKSLITELNQSLQKLKRGSVKASPLQVIDDSGADGTETIHVNIWNTFDDEKYVLQENRNLSEPEVSRKKSPQSEYVFYTTEE